MELLRKTVVFILLYSALHSTVNAQFNKSTTVAVLTNKSLRTWHLGPTVKTLGGCPEEELEIILKADFTAVFQYCQDSKVVSTLTTWEINPTGTTNEWDIRFTKPCQYQSNEKTVYLDKNGIKLLSKAIRVKGVGMDLVFFIPQENLPAKIMVYNFISKD